MQQALHSPGTPSTERVSTRENLTYKNHVCEVVNRQRACVLKLLHVSWKLLLNEVEALLQHNMRLLVLRYTLAPPDFTLHSSVSIRGTVLSASPAMQKATWTAKHMYTS